jgi:DMSO/TMAO reductase YedYZ molybdopterin-dependent catalytic subunit
VGAVPTEQSFTSPLRHERLTARVGTLLGLCFGICFLTGMISHWYYLPDLPLTPPTRPVQGYRFTQGLHVLTGIAAIPLLLVKLWAVYPKLFAAVPLREARALVLHGLERLSILVLVAAPGHQGPTRRTLLRGAVLASGVAVLLNAGNTVPWLRRVSVLAVRTGEGPQGVPINRSAEAAGVTETAVDPGWVLTVAGPDGEVALDRDDLRAMTQRTERLPIACVEGWSASGDWTGVRLSEVLDRAGVPPEADLRVISLQERGSFGVTVLPADFARDDLTLLALGLNGEQLDLDHGYPCRLIAPNRPGVLQTKWLSQLEVST